MINRLGYFAKHQGNPRGHPNFSACPVSVCCRKGRPGLTRSADFETVQFRGLYYLAIVFRGIFSSIMAV